ncbi:helix-turn-helix and ligand-binding sensor domain-containing protein [Aquimarina algiphila]|uniref:helix-turn-helix and ligand-binding sensor domain-containing protein n=1 Tax=Aquimarina algiphila TaxID=2047982 RepID=UPI00249274E7|nr:Two component regulator three Y domain-containing protein [Aquimarina algiphila]
MRIFIYCITLLCFVIPEVIAQKLIPPIYNYEIFEYKAASQNWGMDVSENGELFVANNAGLLLFNGEQWTLYKLPNKTIVRSVCIMKDKIFTGSYEEFGYWKKNKIGQYEYFSLTNLIKNHEFASEEFWQILPYQNTIIFRSFSGIYIYKDNKITVIDPDFIVTDITLLNNKVIVASDNKGLFELINNELVAIQNQELLNHKIIIDMVSYQNGLLIGTKLNGCYLYLNGQTTIWDNAINKELKKHQLNKIQKVSPNSIAFGTIKNGIYLYDTTAKTIDQLNKEIGLQNNTVLSLSTFRNQLWIGLDQGIDRVLLDSSIKYYTDNSGTIGTVYDIANYQDIVYLGSNTGIYYLDHDQLQFIEGSQGHVWDMEILDGQLFCGHNTGTFIVNKNTLEKVSSFSGGYQFIKVPEQKTTFLQGIYTGIAKYHKLEDNSWRVTRVEGINFPVKQLFFENPSTIWAAHPYKGFYRIQLNHDYSAVLDIKEFQTDANAKDYNVKLYNIKNQIIFQSKGKWYKYDPILDKIILFKEFNNYSNKELIHYDEKHFWFIDNENTKQIFYTDLKKDSLAISENQLSRRLIPDAENSVQLSDSINFLTLSNGFSKINFSKLKSNLGKIKIPKPNLYYFKDTKKNYPLHIDILEIPYSNSKDLKIQVSTPSMVQSKYYYELIGSTQQSSYTNDGNIHFQNLSHGNYELNVYTVGINNKKSLPKNITFKIAPPWYLSKLSILGYILSFFLIIFLIRMYNKQKLKRKQNELRKHLEREQKEKIAQLEKDKLTKEIKQKQKELASTTMNIAKKNQIILELKSVLLVNKEKLSSQQSYKAILRKTNNAINNNEDWKRFEISFKELHEDFFDTLLNNYPDLTPKDLKLCAYLKMNLSSKEIAPLMAITIRGVEIHRYRLRKKLKINSSKNLSNFLITFK